MIHSAFSNFTPRDLNTELGGQYCMSKKSCSLFIKENTDFLDIQQYYFVPASLVQQIRHHNVIFVF